MSKTFKLTMFVLSILYVLMGLAMVIWPTESRLVICYAAGAASIIYGIIRIILYFAHKDKADKFQFGVAIGLATVIVGVILLFRANAITAIFAVIAGAVIIVDSIVKLQMALDIRRLGSGRWPVSGIGALIMLIFGVVLLFDPFAGVEVSVICAGVTLILNGATGIWIVSQSALLMKKRTSTVQ